MRPSMRGRAIEGWIRPALESNPKSRGSNAPSVALFARSHGDDAGNFGARVGILFALWLGEDVDAEAGSTQRREEVGEGARVQREDLAVPLDRHGLHLEVGALHLEPPEW